MPSQASDPSQSPSNAANSPTPKGRRVWTAAEDHGLRDLVARFGDARGSQGHWREIAQSLSGRTAKDCRKRWFHSLDPSLRKGRWAPEEDRVLAEAHARLGPAWHAIAKLIPGRKDDQCAKRYNDILNPSARDRLKDWTAEEDRLLRDLVRTLGHHWTSISAELPGRPPLTCRNRWRYLSKRTSAQTMCGAASLQDKRTISGEEGSVASTESVATDAAMATHPIGIPVDTQTPPADGFNALGGIDLNVEHRDDVSYTGATLDSISFLGDDLSRTLEAVNQFSQTVPPTTARACTSESTDSVSSPETTFTSHAPESQADYSPAPVIEPDLQQFVADWMETDSQALQNGVSGTHTDLDALQYLCTTRRVRLSLPPWLCITTTITTTIIIITITITITIIIITTIISTKKPHNSYSIRGTDDIHDMPNIHRIFKIHNITNKTIGVTPAALCAAIDH